VCLSRSSLTAIGLIRCCSLSPHCTRPTPSRARSRERGPAADAVASAGWHPLAPCSQGSAKTRQTPPPTPPSRCSSRFRSPGRCVHDDPRALSCTQRPGDRHHHVDGTPRLRAGKLVLLLLSPPISRPGDTTRGDKRHVSFKECMSLIAFILAQLSSIQARSLAQAPPVQFLCVTAPAHPDPFPGQQVARPPAPDSAPTFFASTPRLLAHPAVVTQGGRAASEAIFRRRSRICWSPVDSSLS
jgi:hypothetical protein